MIATNPGDRPSIAAAWIGAIGVGLVAFGLCLWRLMPGLGFLLVAASVAINLWGVIWGNILGW